MHGANCLIWRGLEWVIRKRQKYVSLRRVVRGAGLACRRSVASTCVHVPCPWAWTVRPTPARTSSSSPWRRVAPARARRALALAPRLTAARAGPCRQSLPLCTLIEQIVSRIVYRPDKSAVRIQNGYHFRCLTESLESKVLLSLKSSVDLTFLETLHTSALAHSFISMGRVLTVVGTAAFFRRKLVIMSLKRYLLEFRMSQSIF